jgi:twinkle protein
MEQGKFIGMPQIDTAISWELGRVVIVTGIPSHGKSEMVDYIATKLNLLHGWKIGYFSPENHPFKYHFSKISSKLIGKSYNAKYMTQVEFDLSHEYIKDNFHFVYPEEDMSFENIMIKAEYLVKRYGIKQFIIDPYNMIEHLMNVGESETNYISRILTKIGNFAKKYQILFWLVAHPRKMSKEKGSLKFNVPDLYDINGSANFYNKADYGLSIYRNFDTKIVDLHIQKIKFKHLGDGGTVNLQYNFINGRYENDLRSVDNFDNSPYIAENGVKISIDEQNLHPDYKQQKIEQPEQIDLLPEYSNFEKIKTEDNVPF